MKLKSGMKGTWTLTDGRVLDGMYVEGGPEGYFLHNHPTAKHGAPPHDKRGYKHSWCLGPKAHWDSFRKEIPHIDGKFDFSTPEWDEENN